MVSERMHRSVRKSRDGRFSAPLGRRPGGPVQMKNPADPQYQTLAGVKSTNVFR